MDTMIYHASRDGYQVVREYDAFGDGTPAVVMSHPELPGCYAYGNADDDEGVIARLDAARRAYIAVSDRRGLAVAEPTVRVRVSATLNGADFPVTA